MSTTRGRPSHSLDLPARDDGYFELAREPLHCLVFLLPLLLIYETGTILYATVPESGVQQRIIAYTLLRQFFSLFGASSIYLPGLAVVVILVCWHLASGRSWRLHGSVMVGMLAESVLLAMPLFVIHAILLDQWQQHQIPLGPVPLEMDLQHRALMRNLVLGVGAGIYEELTFRLILVSILIIILHDLAGMHRGISVILAVGASAAMFSLYHYLGPEPFGWRSFVFRSLAALYFSVTFVLRGFGITAGAHMSYDILLVLTDYFLRQQAG